MRRRPLSVDGRGAYRSWPGFPPGALLTGAAPANAPQRPALAGAQTPSPGRSHFNVVSVQKTNRGPRPSECAAAARCCPEAERAPCVAPDGAGGNTVQGRTRVPGATQTHADRRRRSMTTDVDNVNNSFARVPAQVDSLDPATRQSPAARSSARSPAKSAARHIPLRVRPAGASRSLVAHELKRRARPVRTAWLRASRPSMRESPERRPGGRARARPTRRTALVEAG